MPSSRFARVALVACLSACGGASPSDPSGSVPNVVVIPGGPVHATVSYRPGQPVAQFDPTSALGAGLDGQEAGQVDRMLSPQNIQEMRTVGFKPISYRLRTELAGEVWHWNPQGTWSDPANQQGYWVSAATSATPIDLSWGYRLPRRGNTVDQAGNDGYSRLDDDDLFAFWKSNPYLDAHYTGESNAMHPQWVVADLDSPQPIDAIRIAWGDPYAAEFEVQYAATAASAIEEHISDPGVWAAFPHGTIHGAAGGDVTIRLADAPVVVQQVRVLMTASATKTVQAADIRDTVGYAVRELYVGQLDANGAVRDLVRHGPDKTIQSAMFVSSTDSWHRATDQDINIEQPGLDRIYKSGLAQGSVMVPVALLYDTPENILAEIAFLKSRGYTVSRVELGEEPEEQWGAPEDAANLYMQRAKSLVALDPTLQLGGPSLVTDISSTWPDLFIRRFWSYLASHNGTSAMQFFSFEYYPFDHVCDDPATQLARLPDHLRKTMNNLRSDGLPPGVPVLITEYGYSPYSDRTEVDIEGAVLNAEAVALFLTLGVSGAYLYGYEPNEIIHEFSCTWGNLMLFGLGSDGSIAYKTAAYWAATMMSQQWTMPSGGNHKIYGATTDASEVSAYPLVRPDGRWSVLVTNRSPNVSHPLVLGVHDESAALDYELAGPIDVYQYSRDQYVWIDDEDRGHPQKSDSPSHMAAQRGDSIFLPPYSITVIQAGSLSRIP